MPEETLLFEHAHHGVGIADIDGQKHGGNIEVEGDKVKGANGLALWDIIVYIYLNFTFFIYTGWTIRQ